MGHCSEQKGGIMGYHGILWDVGVFMVPYDARALIIYRVIYMLLSHTGAWKVPPWVLEGSRVCGCQPELKL